MYIVPLFCFVDPGFATAVLGTTTAVVLRRGPFFPYKCYFCLGLCAYISQAAVVAMTVTETLV